MASLTTIRHLNGQIKEIEKTIIGQVRLRDEFKGLLTVPGIRVTLGLTIMLEVGHIDRFPSAGDYASYCRRVESIRRSNDKEGNYQEGLAHNQEI